MPLILPNDLANEQLADGEKLQQNFLAIEDYVNQDTITRDGSTAMTGALLLPGPPAQANQAASKAYVDAVIASAMVGEIKMYGGDAEPPSWMFCRGQAISRFTYSGLFQIFGIKFGGGDGSTTFNLPDMKGQYPVGYNPGGAYFAVGIGERAGAKDAAVVAHTHDMGHTHAAGQSGGQSASHWHLMENHTHGVGGSTGGQSNSHYHGSGEASYEGFVYWDAQGGGQFGGAGGGGMGVYGITGYASTDHTHSFSGGTGGPSPNNTGHPSNDHSHGISIPAFAGSTSSVGTSATNANLPPSVSVNFIVRVI